MPRLEYVVVLDFEATCDDSNAPTPQEVIEFPSVLVSMATLESLDEFQSFVKPHHHPWLTDFCRELTGIQQEEIDAGRIFPEVLELHLQWLQSHGLPISADGVGPNYAFVLCGDWDLGTMMPAQCRACVPRIESVPWPYRRWINIKRPFVAWRGGGKARGMAGMLTELGLELIGRHHRGIDDCRNIARIARALVESGIALEITTSLSPSRYPPIALTLHRNGEAREVFLQKRALGTLLGLASGAFRAQATRVFLADGREIVGEKLLLDLLSGTQLTVTDE